MTADCSCPLGRCTFLERAIVAGAKSWPKNGRASALLVYLNTSNNTIINYKRFYTWRFATCPATPATRNATLSPPCCLGPPSIFTLVCLQDLPTKSLVLPVSTLLFTPYQLHPQFRMNACTQLFTHDANPCHHQLRLTFVSYSAGQLFDAAVFAMY
jgi:hypothetical protein